MKTVNLQEYPVFWKAFRECLSKHDDLNLVPRSSSRTTWLLQEHFGLYVNIQLGSTFANAQMEDEDYVWFTLRWA